MSFLTCSRGLRARHCKGSQTHGLQSFQGCRCAWQGGLSHPHSTPDHRGGSRPRSNNSGVGDTLVPFRPEGCSRDRSWQLGTGVFPGWREGGLSWAPLHSRHLLLKGHQEIHPEEDTGPGMCTVQVVTKVRNMEQSEHLFIEGWPLYVLHFRAVNKHVYEMFMAWNNADNKTLGQTPVFIFWLWKHECELTIQN